MVYSRVGIIVNPMAGRDIRRIVSEAEFKPLYLKINAAKRFIIGLDSIGVDEVLLMPEAHGISESIAEELEKKVSLKIKIINMNYKNTVDDTIQAAHIMKNHGVALIAGFGGDGTLRAIFKGAGIIPIIGIPLGTNNVLSRSEFEPTVLGIVAGLVAKNYVPVSKVAIPMKTLELRINGSFRDVALIDIAFLLGGFEGAKAIWDIDQLKYIVYSKCEPTDIGLASLGGNLYPVSLQEDKGLFIELGDTINILAVIAPGLIKRIGVKSFSGVDLNTPIEIPNGTYVVAFDGERELMTSGSDKLEVVIRRNGPLLIDPQLVLKIFSESRLMKFLRGE